MKPTQATKHAAKPTPRLAIALAFVLPFTHSLALAQTSTTWIKAADENRTFQLLQPTLVRYGAGTAWIERTLSGSISCTNQTFGRDPMFGVAKSCQTAQAPAPTTWVKAADENQAFRVLEPTSVRYGANTAWVERTLNGSISCSNQFFGSDPIAGVAKSCQIPSKSTTSTTSVQSPTLMPVSTLVPTSAEWVKAANENQNFSVSTPREVRYGAGTRWVQRNLSGTVSCTNIFFGSDPAPGTLKSCETSNGVATSTATAPTSTTATTWAATANENQTFRLDALTVVRYGSGTSWIQRTLSGTVSCNNSTFGSDPIAGVLKSCQILSGAVTASAPTPTPAPAPTASPINHFSCAAGAITCLEITSTSTSTQASVPVTFGQPFKAGDWRASSQSLIARVDGIAVPVQTDETSSHRDGSTRFAVVSAQVGNMAPGQNKILNLFAGPKVVSAPVVPANPDWNLEVETQLFDASGNLTATLVARPQAQLAAQIASNSGRRLSGAVASEYTVVTDFRDKQTGTSHPHLTARFHTRLVDAGARIRSDVVMENTRTWTAAPGNITYSMVVKRNGVTLHSQPKFTHFRQARWHKVVWSGNTAEPKAYVRHHMPYFMASRAVWNYNLAVTIPETRLAENYTRLAAARAAQVALGPMGNTLLEKYMPMTGGRGEIGPYPVWTVNYLLSQDPRALEVMLAVADSAGSAPVHYREEATDSPINIDSHPNISINPAWSTPKLPTVVNGDTFWEVDTAHQGSYTYVPYLVTGDAYYLDEMMFWSSYNTVVGNPDYRGAGLGLAKDNQVRGQAWAMRAIGETFRAVPDAHPRKEHFRNRLDVNLNWYFNEYPNNPNAAQLFPLNALPKPDEQHKTGPWQNDFVAIVFAQLAENNDPKALETLNWFSKFNVGRFNAQASGFCTADAAGYFWEITDSGSPITSWNILYQKNFPSAICNSDRPIDGYPDWAGGYAGGARAMLAAATNAGVTGAGAVYLKWKALTPKMDADFAKNPTHAIVPR